MDVNLYKKLFVIVSLITLAVFVASCSTIKNELGIDKKAGLTYNELEVSEEEIDADLKALADNKPLVELLKDQDPPLLVDGKVSDTYRARWVNTKMRTLAIKEIRIKHKMKVTKKDKDDTIALAKNYFPSDSQEKTDEIWEAFPESFKNRLVEEFAEQNSLLRDTPKVTDKEVEDYYNENKDALSAPCESGKTIFHIVVDTEKEAKDIEKEIKDGGDFEKIAKDKSTDAGSGAAGGSLGCFQPGNFVEEFENAAAELQPGSMSGIVKTEYGYHILKAEAYSTPELKDLKEQIRTQLKSGKEQELFKEVNESLKKAKVKVSPKYGRVSFEIDEVTGEKSELPSIVPLKEESSTTTTTKSSAVPAT